jgi:hypothetical protein
MLSIISHDSYQHLGLAYTANMDSGHIVCVDRSQTVLEHHRSFILSPLVSQLEEEKPFHIEFELHRNYLQIDRPFISVLIAAKLY